MIQIKYDDIITIAEGRHRRETSWRNKDWKWSGLVHRLSNTHRTAETVKEYANAPKSRQAEIKDIGGFVGGYLIKGSRKRENVQNRILITLDADEKAAGLWEIFIEKFKCSACVYSTHKHTPENPRLRFVIPLSREVFADEYEPIARRVADMIGIEAFDPTAYQVQQLMYWPSTSSDGEFYFQYQDGQWLDADEILGTYRDWKDSSAWPIATKEKEILHAAIKKQGDPTEKTGIVGAFCRTYAIAEAIDTYLSHVYIPGESEHRYTFKGGSTAEGLVLFEDKFSFSFHGTDPTSGKLCNAFDLVRIHLFADRDENTSADTPINKKPSYLAMQDLATKDKAVRSLIGQERLAESTADFADELTEQSVEEVSTEWLQELEVDKKTLQYLSSANNISLILENDPNLKGRLAQNLFEHKNMALKKLPWHTSGGTYPTELLDSDDSGLRYYFEMTYGIFAPNKIHDGLALHMLKKSYHPVKDYLESTQWDGKERLETLLVEYFGADDTPYVRAIMKKALTAAVARIYEPGIKFDYMVTLTGEEGLFKSTFFNKLSNGWFTGNITELKGKEAQEKIQGVWIVEMQELAAFNKAEVELVKTFISNQKDRFRVAFGRRAQDFLRQCILFGTTNTLAFLKAGANGNRRFWPVEVGKNPINKSVSFDLTKAEIAQIWAEAKISYEAGEDLYLSPELENVARFMQKLHTEQDVRKGLIEKYLDIRVPEDWDSMGICDRRNFIENNINETDDVLTGTMLRERVCTLEIWCEILGGNMNNMSTHNGREIANIMRNMDGWIDIGRVRTSKYGQQTSYQRVVVNY